MGECCATDKGAGDRASGTGICTSGEDIGTVGYANHLPAYTAQYGGVIDGDSARPEVGYVMNGANARISQKDVSFELVTGARVSLHRHSIDAEPRNDVGRSGRLGGERSGGDGGGGEKGERC